MMILTNQITINKNNLQFSLISKIVLCIIFVFFTSKNTQAETHNFTSNYSEFKKTQIVTKANIKLYPDQINRVWYNYKYILRDYPAPKLTLPKDPLRNSFLLLKAQNTVNQIGLLKKKHVEEHDIRNLQKEHFKSNIWWQKITHQNSLDRISIRLQNKHSLNLVKLSLQGLKLLDKIDDLDLLDQTQTIKLYATLYRINITNQVVLNQPELALISLAKLDRINPIKEDWVMHYYFAWGLNQRLNRFRKNTGKTESNLRSIRSQKNKHLLYSIELRFGIESIEFKETYKKIKFEELGNPRT